MLTRRERLTGHARPVDMMHVASVDPAGHHVIVWYRWVSEHWERDHVEQVD